MLDVPNNPAGRLVIVLNALRSSAGGGATLGDIWRHAASGLTLDGSGDPIRVRAEAGFLYREVESAVMTLPIEDDREALLSEREAWVQPIFGWGLQDHPGQHYTAESLVPQVAINALASLGSVLRRNSPEFKVTGSKETLDGDLAAIYDKLGALLVEVTTEEGLTDQARANIARPLVGAMEDITYVRLRGLRPLHDNVHFARAHIVADNLQGRAQDAEPLDRTRRWLSAIVEVLVSVERLVVPAGAGVATALLTRDPIAALTAGVSARVAIGGGSTAKTSGAEGDAKDGDVATPQ